MKIEEWIAILLLLSAIFFLLAYGYEAYETYKVRQNQFYVNALFFLAAFFYFLFASFNAYNVLYIKKRSEEVIILV